MKNSLKKPVAAQRNLQIGFIRCLSTGHGDFKLLMYFVGTVQVFICLNFSEVQDFENFELSPMHTSVHVCDVTCTIIT